MLRWPMVLVGITGGLASGKTTVARMFEKLGAKVIDADGLARTVVEPGKPAWKDIRRHFGPQVINSDRTLNRELLAEIVFADPRRLQILQKVIHPRVAREQARLVKEFASAFPCAVIIYDAAMLIEAGAHRRMDHVIVMKVDQATQIERACRRNGWTKTQALRRIRQQMPHRRKLQHADTVLDSRWPRSRLRQTVQSLYRTYLEESRTKGLR